MYHDFLMQYCYNRNMELLDTYEEASNNKKGVIKMMIKRNFEEEAFDKVPDAMDRYDLIKIHKEEIETEAHKIGEKSLKIC